MLHSGSRVLIILAIAVQNSHLPRVTISRAANFFFEVLIRNPWNFFYLILYVKNQRAKMTSFLMRLPTFLDRFEFYIFLCLKNVRKTMIQRTSHFQVFFFNIHFFNFFSCFFRLLQQKCKAKCIVDGWFIEKGHFRPFSCLIPQRMLSECSSAQNISVVDMQRQKLE